MSFFSRLNNLVQGFSHDLQTRIEKKHPNIVQPHEDISTTKELKEAISHFSILEQEIDIELQIADQYEKIRLQTKKKEYQKEKEKLLILLSTMEHSPNPHIISNSPLENESTQVSIENSPVKTNSKRKRTL